MSVCAFQIAFDKSGIQFTPNGPNLVLLNGMQLPSCRLVNFHHKFIVYVVLTRAYVFLLHFILVSESAFCFPLEMDQCNVNAWNVKHIPTRRML